MEVNQSEYRQQLLPILKNIAAAKFVSFDLEMSGITTRARFGDRSQEIGKPSLQQQYEEMRSAAELYQIVQFGITCVEEHVEKGFYLARPYNFNLNPLSADGVDLKLERNFTFSSSACDFLRKNNFDFGRIFTDGVPYLSRREKRDVELDYSLRESRNANIPDISVSANDTTNLEFVRNARKTIAYWISHPKPENNFVDVFNEDGPVKAPLDAYQRRLIYQLVRKEFPALRTFPRNDSSYMRIEKLDLKREAEIQKKRLEKFNYSIVKQTGLRWIFEALSGGDLSSLDPAYFCSKLSEDYATQMKAVTSELRSIIEALKIKKHIIVGHNLFTDLGFLYSAFVDKLPLDVHHFQVAIHKMFPLVFDTKYIATNSTSMNARNGLRELLEPFKKVATPLVLLHEDHTSYGTTFGRDHEAGFDSWMTAELFIKLTSKLCADRKPLLSPVESDESDDYFSPDEDGGGAALNGRSDSIGGSLDAIQPPESLTKQLSNRFAALANRGPDDRSCSEPEIEGPKQWIPDITDSFWDTYVNKLRVNASEGGVCDLEGGNR